MDYISIDTPENASYLDIWNLKMGIKTKYGNEPETVRIVQEEMSIKDKTYHSLRVWFVASSKEALDYIKKIGYLSNEDIEKLKRGAGSLLIMSINL